jgi:XTP/dITP diphosphohydrolase
MQLVFATNNLHKIKEITAIIGKQFNILGLKDINCLEEIPETKDTIMGNALEKAEFIYDKYGYNCFADDTGLEITSLNNRPGVYSARYAGEDANFENNMNKVLTEMNKIEKREACFKTVIALIIKGEKYFFEGQIKGFILKEKRGSLGFGYDPIFMPVGFDKSFAELSPEVKNAISHRAIATKKLIDFLLKLNKI